MTRERVSMRRVASDRNHVPLHATTQSPLVAFVVLIAIALLAAAIAVASADPQLTPFMGAFALLFVAAAFVVHRWSAMLEQRVVRVDTARDGLRFVAPAGVQLGFALLGLLALLPVVSVLLFGLPSEAPLGPLLPLVVGGAALAGLGQEAWALRIPDGLTLSEAGLRGVRGSTPVELSWDDLSHASVVSVKGARLVLNLRSGRGIVVDPRRIGSDPNVVAPVIDFFLENPRHRAVLSTPVAALALVEEYATTNAD